MVFAATVFFIVLTALSLLWARATLRQIRTETPAQRAARLRNDEDTVVIMMLQDRR